MNFEKPIRLTSFQKPQSHFSLLQVLPFVFAVLFIPSLFYVSLSLLTARTLRRTPLGPALAVHLREISVL